MARKQIMLGALILALAVPAWAVGPTVTNVQARQWQDDTRRVEISYTLTDPDSATVYVSVAISNDGGSTYAITPTTLWGERAARAAPASRYHRASWVFALEPLPSTCCLTS